MSDSTTTDIFLSTATGNQTSFDTEPVALGADNGAMFEVRLKAGTLTATGVRVTLQASNDGQNWTPYTTGGSTDAALVDVMLRTYRKA